MADFKATLATLAQAEEFHLTCAQVQGLLLDDNFLGELFQRCQIVKHALGFVQIRLGNINGKAIRLHLWSRESVLTSVSAGSEIHSHPWPLRSFVLCGSINNRIYEVVESDSGTDELYKVERHGKRVHHTRLHVRVSWKIVSTRLIHAGSSYAIDVSTFHSTDFAESGSLTLIVVGQRKGLPARVVKPLDGPTTIIKAPVLLSESGNRLVRESIIEMLRRV
ncbi:hypothetical protein AB0C38_13765 [Amycolatopsis sp. NPDC048633]|uniref:hypothetical protein n=1 Tax=Amycolatopsis sp. NPDC048633 TaxID=3157095 RepID=UPI003408FAD3